MSFIIELFEKYEYKNGSLVDKVKQIIQLIDDKTNNKMRQSLQTLQSSKR